MLDPNLPFPTFPLSHALASIRQTPEQLLQNLWEGVSYGIFVLDVLAQGEEFRFAAFNPAIARTSPIPIAQLIGKTLGEALPAAVAATSRDRYRNCIRAGHPLSFEEQFSHAGQETSWLLTV